ncbi:MAG: hypothetical protein C0606_00390 [Hyphomicrobiales bacterium]|nr:MAG: hypothetical protein C0606_00390 [Hyphomicrobiales bacterium]
MPGIVQVTDYELRDFSAETTETIVRRIAAALLAERKRGSEGHWSYSLTRHIALQQAYAAEYDTLAGG